MQSPTHRRRCKRMQSPTHRRRYTRMQSPTHRSRCTRMQSPPRRRRRRTQSSDELDSSINEPNGPNIFDFAGTVPRHNKSLCRFDLTEGFDQFQCKLHHQLGPSSLAELAWTAETQGNILQFVGSALDLAGAEHFDRVEPTAADQISQEHRLRGSCRISWMSIGAAQSPGRVPTDLHPRTHLHHEPVVISVTVGFLSRSRWRRQTRSPFCCPAGGPAVASVGEFYDSPNERAR